MPHSSLCLILIFLMIGNGSFGIVKFETVNVNEIISYIKSGSKCVNIIQEFITRIDTYNKNYPKINAVISMNPSALDEAQVLDTFYSNTGNLKGSLHCVPMLIKDNIDVCAACTCTVLYYILLCNY